MHRIRVAAVAGLAGCAALNLSSTESATESASSGLPDHLRQQQFEPNVPYPNWDTNWVSGHEGKVNLLMHFLPPLQDFRNPSKSKIKKALGVKQAPSTDEDFKAVIHQLYAEAGATKSTPEKVDKHIEKHKDDLPGLFLKTLTRVRGANRHFLLVRHGQYEYSDEGDEKQVLTPLGRIQAEKTGIRLAEVLEPALTTPGRQEQHVRVHVSTMTRAKETADIISAQLESKGGSFARMAPTPLLVEGSPPVHNIPDPLYSAEQVSKSFMEAGFRSLFKRLSLADEREAPCEDGAPSTGEVGKTENKNAGNEHAGVGSDGKFLPRNEYEIVVCHANVIRFFVLRALQLPPEAWFRIHPNNCSITHLRVRPDGAVDLFCLGEAGHLTIDESTFNMTARYPFR
jgi:serine/threonine-protein phosphatase PGAM5